MSRIIRAVVVSRVYADAANRGKLKALSAQGAVIAAAVPDRWTPAGIATEQQTTFGDDVGVRTVPIPLRGSSRSGADPAWNAKALRRLLNDFRPDLVHIEEDPWTRGAATAARQARRLRIPYIIFTRESLPASYGMTSRFRRSRTLTGASGLLAINQLASRLAIRGRPTMRHRVMPQLGVSLPLTAQRVPHTGLAIGFFGRLIPEKGLDLLFRACVKLVGRWTITVVGTGPAQEELEGLAERLGIAGRITWLGALPRASVDQVWPGLDCVVAPSRTAPRWIEIAPRAAYEAMAHGIAVVASNSGALPETLGPAGVTVPEEDVGALTEALQRLHDSPAELERLGAAGRRRLMEQFTDAALASRTLEFWNEVLGATG